MDIRLTIFKPVFYGKYRSFSKKASGTQAYQESKNYIQWLRENNSLITTGCKDFILVTNDADEIVVCTYLQKNDVMHISCADSLKKVISNQPCID
jgi:hypothetical protein